MVSVVDKENDASSPRSERSNESKSSNRSSPRSPIKIVDPYPITTLPIKVDTVPRGRPLPRTADNDEDDVSPRPRVQPPRVRPETNPAVNKPDYLDSLLTQVQPPIVSPEAKPSTRPAVQPAVLPTPLPEVSTVPPAVRPPVIIDPRPTIQPYKDICIRFGEDKNDRAMIYDVVEDTVQAQRSKCPIDHMWTPKPVKGNPDTFYLISSKNKEALTQDPDDSINVHRMKYAPNQRWKLLNVGCGLYEISNDDTGDNLALMNNDEVGVIPEEGSKDGKSITFVVGTTECEH